MNGLLEDTRSLARIWDLYGHLIGETKNCLLEAKFKRRTKEITSKSGQNSPFLERQQFHFSNLASIMNSNCYEFMLLRLTGNPLHFCQKEICYSSFNHLLIVSFESITVDFPCVPFFITTYCFFSNFHASNKISHPILSTILSFSP